MLKNVCRMLIFLVWIVSVFPGPVGTARAQGPVALKPGPGPLDNPLKGWCTYTAAGPIRQPYSMVYEYASWKELEPREGEYRFAAWEKHAWDAPGAAGRRVIFRLYLDYPGIPSGVPDWLLAQGVKTHPYKDQGGGRSPDYDDPALVAGLERLIAALGRRYDHDPRVAFVTLGTLGFWGEWHTYPHTQLFASAATQRRVVAAYRKAFPDKALMARYPDGVTGTQGWLGYHDDMFPQDTLGPEDWMFLPKMRRSGRTDNWKAVPIGGEMEPGAADRWLGNDYAKTMAAVDAAHMTWVGPYSPAIDGNSSPAFLAHCRAVVRRMGYQYALKSVQASPHGGRLRSLRVVIAGENQGVAPFYYPWPVRLALMDMDRRVIETLPTNADVRGWLPGPFTLRAAPTVRARPGRYLLAIGIIDPMTGTPGVRFANSLPCIGGWTVLTDVRVTQ